MDGDDLEDADEDDDDDDEGATGQLSHRVPSSTAADSTLY